MIHACREPDSLIGSTMSRSITSAITTAVTTVTSRASGQPIRHSATA